MEMRIKQIETVFWTASPKGERGVPLKFVCPIEGFSKTFILYSNAELKQIIQPEYMVTWAISVPIQFIIGR